MPTILERIILEEKKETAEFPVLCKKCKMLETTKETPRFISRLCQCGIIIYYKRSADQDHPRPHFVKVVVPKEEYDPHHKKYGSSHGYKQR